jgi:hypothetical protein
MITLTNDFHGTSVNLRAKIGDVLTMEQAARARLVLCGIHGCKCGGCLNQRGKQTVGLRYTNLADVQIVAVEDGEN